MLSNLVSNADVIAACMAAISVFSACLLVWWPYIVTDTFDCTDQAGGAGA